MPGHGGNEGNLFNADPKTAVCVSVCLQQSVRDNLRLYKKVVKTSPTRHETVRKVSRKKGSRREYESVAESGRENAIFFVLFCFEFYHEIEGGKVGNFS